MELIDDLRRTADIAEAGDKPHWAKLMRDAALALGNQETVVKAAHGTSGRIKSAAIKLGYDPATADHTALDFIIERAHSAQGK